jgi:hypothetical protein
VARPRIVIVGAGFAGYHAARYFLYLPLLPEVAGRLLDPRQVTIPLTDTLPGVKPLLGEVTAVDPDQRRVYYHDPEGRGASLGYLSTTTTSTACRARRVPSWPAPSGSLTLCTVSVASTSPGACSSVS